MQYTEGVDELGTEGRLEGPQVRKKSGEVCLSAAHPLLRHDDGRDRLGDVYFSTARPSVHRRNRY